MHTEGVVQNVRLAGIEQLLFHYGFTHRTHLAVTSFSY